MRNTIKIPACGKDCRLPRWEPGSRQWCKFDVQSPSIDWKGMDPSVPLADVEKLQVYVMEDAADVAPCLAAHKASMTDPVIGIDCEWWSARKRLQKVAAIQLASSSVVVVIRPLLLGGIPDKVSEFCRGAGAVGVGFHWFNDEDMLQRTFRKGRRNLFTHFVDIKKQAERMGYHDAGLAKMSEIILDYKPAKFMEVTKSNWEQHPLTEQQISYAALDALLTADIFRRLRQMHAAGEPCTDCSVPSGQWVADLDLQCRQVGCEHRPYQSPKAFLLHMQRLGHSGNIDRCDGCSRFFPRGRIRAESFPTAHSGRWHRSSLGPVPRIRPMFRASRHMHGLLI